MPGQHRGPGRVGGPASVGLEMVIFARGQPASQPASRGPAKQPGPRKPACFQRAPECPPAVPGFPGNADCLVGPTRCAWGAKASLDAPAGLEHACGERQCPPALPQPQLLGRFSALKIEGHMHTPVLSLCLVPRQHPRRRRCHRLQELTGPLTCLPGVCSVRRTVWFIRVHQTL